MPDPIKNMYNCESLHNLARDLQSACQSFQADAFLKEIMDENWDSLELKDRINHIAVKLGKYLPQDYSEAISVIDKVAANYGNWKTGFGFFFPTFVEIYGQDESNWDISMGALERYTEYASAEFAVRVFIIKHEERMMAQMRAWSRHESEFVRRLSCEGCRPALPWAQALNSFKKDPGPILPILEQLKTDPSESVRRSVANNLNDISKTHPDLVAGIAKEWYGKNKDTDWIVKHGCRTLLKKGNQDVLAIFGYHDDTPIEMNDFALAEEVVSIGREIYFSFTISSNSEAKVRLEYGIDYVKSNGKRNRKIFKISEVTLKEKEKKSYTKKHSFADVSVRKHYPGIHSITLMINGVERDKLDFELKA